ncbi:latrophilin-like protein LAT-2 [Penaeus japonicus]|uniref:latrophilin-like protein LAT-2 n=1 Tax=Penaeus japonicus TaxID=27405 RepID=UPI001C711436|nr:latrophilin-like protein LAT-2 [Penaeus japonicus]
MTQALEQANSPSDIERVQEAVEKVGLALVDLPTNFTKDLQNDNLHMRVSSQPASYYKNASARRFVSASAPNTSIEFPDQFYKGHVSENESVKIIFTTYRALHSVDNVIPLNPMNASKDDFPADNQVNSKIIGSIMVGAKCWHSAEGYVKLELGHVYKGDAFQIRNIRCVWWDEAARAWNTSGCFLKANDAFHSVCHCNHLTYFSLLMDVSGVRADDDVLESDGHFAARWIGRVGSSASVLCLGLCLVCILALRTLRNTLCWRIRGHLCATLLLAYLLVLTAFKSIGVRVVCAVVGPLLHYALLCVFMWGTVEACNMYVNLVRVWRTQRTLFKYYLGLSYGFPVVVVGLTLGVTRGQAYDTTHTCWLAAGAALWVFVGFLVVILAINFAIFALVMRIVVNNAKDIKNRPYHKRDADVRDRIWGSVTIFVVLGLTWITGILFAIFESSVFSVVFSLTSSFQGVWIFLFGIVLDKRIRRDIVCLMARYRNTYSVFQQSKQQSRSTDNHQVVFSPSNTEKYEEIE